MLGLVAYINCTFPTFSVKCLVAQLVECLGREEGVLGSIPSQTQGFFSKACFNPRSTDGATVQLASNE